MVWSKRVDPSAGPRRSEENQTQICVLRESFSSGQTFQTPCSNAAQRVLWAPTRHLKHSLLLLNSHRLPDSFRKATGKIGSTFFLGAKVISELSFLPPFAFRSLTTPGKDRRSNSLLPFHAKDGRFSPTAHGDHSISARRAPYFTLHRGSLGLRPVPACAAACCDIPCPLAL